MNLSTLADLSGIKVGFPISTMPEKVVRDCLSVAKLHMYGDCARWRNVSVGCGRFVSSERIF